MVRDMDKWFDLNIDLDSRTLYMGSAGSYENEENGVDYAMAEYLIKGMHVLESKNTKPICIVMNNPGGDWYHGMAIYDAIKSSTCECTIKAYGYVMSMGSVILQAADYRIMMPNSRFMMHYGYDGKAGHSKTVYRWADEGKRINWEMENIYLDSMLRKEEEMGHGHLAKTITAIVKKQQELEFPPKTKTTKFSFSRPLETKREEVREALKELLNFDTILNPADTIALGLADSVFGDK